MDTKTIDASRVVSLIDLTLLPDHCPAEDIDALCARAKTSLGNTAAVCIPSDHVSRAAHALQGSGIRIATVAAFPTGKISDEELVTDCRASAAAGADEIDVVIPWEDVQVGDIDAARRRVALVKASAPGLTVKAILETGALREPDLIRAAARAALQGGADFIKTSTGKGHPGADLEAVKIMVDEIAAAGGAAGLKPSGGISSLAQASDYIRAFEDRLGAAAPERFRIGASGLLDKLAPMDDVTVSDKASGY